MKLEKQTQVKEIKVKQKQEFKIIGSLRKIPGLKLWEFDYNKMEVKEASIKKSKYIDTDLSAHEKNSVFHNKNAYYYQCVNLKNALKKANKIIKYKSGVEDYFKLVKGIVVRKELI